MGICGHKKVIPLEECVDFTRLYTNERKRIIEDELEHNFISFKNDLFKDILKKLPCSYPELEQLIANAYTITSQCFAVRCKNKRLNTIDLQRGLHIFKYKCKSQEGYFRYYNDIKSLQACFDLKKEIIDQFIREGTDLELLFNKYHKAAKGTYSLQGFDELKKILFMEKNEMDDYLMFQYEENMHRLKSIYNDLLNLKVIDLEIYSKTVGNSISNSLHDLHN